MAISDASKIDRSFKAILGKAFTTTQKQLDNEDASTGPLVGSSSVLAQDGGIPTTAPGDSTDVMTYYGDGTLVARYRLINDISSPLNRAWYASTDGSSLNQMRATREGNWVSPTFGNYTIRIFLTKTTSTTAAYLQEIFFSDATSPVFDYKAGILTFESDPLAAYASVAGGPPDGIQIAAYRYTGILLSQIFDGNGNYTGGLSDQVITGSGTALAKFINPDKTFIVSSPHAMSEDIVEQSSEAPAASNANWHAIAHADDGRIISVGHDSGNTTSYIQYSYGMNDWYLVEESFTPTQLRALFAIDSGDILAGGVGGSTNLIHSADGGLTWADLNNPSLTPINAIWATSTSNVYIAGAGGVIKKTINLGSSYTTQTTTPFTDAFLGMWGIDEDNIYAVGENGCIMYTDGLGTWSAETSGVATDLTAVFGVGDKIYVAGVDGVILSSDGDTTWTAETGLAGSFDATGIWGITDGDITRLYICGNDGADGVLYYSTGDGTWTEGWTFTGKLVYGITSGASGVYVASESGLIEVLVSNPILHVSGNGLIDAGLQLYGGVVANYAQLGLLTTSASTPTTIKSTGYNNFDPHALRVHGSGDRDVIGVVNLQVWSSTFDTDDSEDVAYITTDGSMFIAGSMTMPEITAPATPSAAMATFYFKSNGVIGSGHRTQLVVKWADGTETIIAESPATP